MLSMCMHQSFKSINDRAAGQKYDLNSSLTLHPRQTGPWTDLKIIRNSRLFHGLIHLPIAGKTYKATASHLYSHSVLSCISCYIKMDSDFNFIPISGCGGPPK